MLRGVGAGRVSSSCVSGPERFARPMHPQLKTRPVKTRPRPPGPPRRPSEAGPEHNRTPQGGVAAGASTSRWTRSTRRRISPWSPLRGYAHGTGVRRRVHNTPTLGAPGARHPDDRTTGRAGGDWGGWPPPDHRSHPVGPGRPYLGPAPARRDRPSETQGGRLGRRRRPSRTARKLIRATGQSRRAARGPGGKRRCQTGKEGGTGPRIRTRSAAPKSSTRITAATGSPLKRPPSPGSHRDGPEACSPGEGRADTRSLDGRGRGESTIAKYGSEHSLRVGHHVQGPGTEAPAAAAR